MTNKVERHKAVISTQTCTPQIPWQSQEKSQFDTLVTLLFNNCLAGQLQNTNCKPRLQTLKLRKPKTNFMILLFEFKILCLSFTARKKTADRF